MTEEKNINFGVNHKNMIPILEFLSRVLNDQLLLIAIAILLKKIRENKKLNKKDKIKMKELLDIFDNMDKENNSAEIKNIYKKS